jgi:hypothetical protein
MFAGIFQAEARNTSDDQTRKSFAELLWTEFPVV